MQANKIIVEVRNAFAQANAGYLTRNPEMRATLGDKMQGDVAAGLKVFENLTAPQLDTLAQLGVDWDRFAKYLANCSNVKVAKRMPMFVAFIVTSDARYLKGSAQTALLEWAGLCIGAKNKDALRFASTGKGDENTSDSIPVARARALQKAFGRVGASSRDTQASVSFSKGGMLDGLGMVTPWAKGDTMPGLVDCKLNRALTMLVSSASDTTLDAWAATANPKRAVK